MSLVELSPREEKEWADIRECLEIKLVEVLLTSDANVKLFEYRNRDRNPVFVYEMTTMFQKFDIVTISMDRRGWTRDITYKMTLRFNGDRNLEFDSSKELIEWVKENLS